MSDELFFNIMRQLTRIDYAGEVYIHRYNEPLADKAYALSRIRDIRAFVPRASIVIFTNGDYLDRSYLDSLAVLGVKEIQATVHAGAGGKTDIDSLIREQNRRIMDLGLSYEIEGSAALKWRIATARYDERLTVIVNAHDFYRGKEQGNTWAYDRGGVVQIPRTYVRKKPCLVQFSEMEIEWDGTILPCCQINNDAFAHDNYVLGKLDSTSDIFETWFNKSYIKWRLEMSTYKQKNSPCTTCNHGEPQHAQDELKRYLGDLHAALAEAAARP